MIKHIVMWKLKEKAEGKTNLENARIIKCLLEGLKDHIKEIGEIEVGLNLNRSEVSFDVVLYSFFKDKDALEVYQSHPEHKKVSDFIGSIRDMRVAVDYEI